MALEGLGIECLDLDVRLAFFDVAGGARFDCLAGLDHTGFVHGLVVLDDAESLGKFIVLDVLHVDAQLAVPLQLTGATEIVIMLSRTMASSSSWIS